MKYFTWLLLLFLSVGVSFEGWADSANYHDPNRRVRGSTKIPPKYQKDLEKIFDTKLYHDPYYVHTVMSSMDGLDKEKKNLPQDINLSVALNEKDVDAWHQTTDAMPMKIKKKATTEEILKDPKGSYVKMMMDQEVPVLSSQTVENVSDINKQNITDLLIMVTESGTDVGAKPAPVDFKIE